MGYHLAAGGHDHPWLHAGGSAGIGAGHRPLVSGRPCPRVLLIRGTPLLLQIWLLYYGLGSLFPQFPWIRESELWPYLRQAWPYACLLYTSDAADDLLC